jgi:hypothetical protein
MPEAQRYGFLCERVLLLGGNVLLTATNALAGYAVNVEGVEELVSNKGYHEGPVPAAVQWRGNA